MTLLDAVDALTLNDAVTRFTGADHHHEWLELYRETTAEERAAARKANTKLPKSERVKVERMVKTGEWWCPWHDGPFVVRHRPDDDAEERIDRYDADPLLDQLEARIGSTLGDRGTSGVSGGGSPVDVTAADKATEIRDKVERWLNRIDVYPPRDVPLVALLRRWYRLRDAMVNPVGEDDLYRRQLVEWETQVRDILDPPEQVPYRGQACPSCGATHAKTIVDGESEGSVALWAILRPAYRREGSYGICRACNQVLARDDDPIMLRQKMNGTVATGRVGVMYQTETHV